MRIQALVLGGLMAVGCGTPDDGVTVGAGTGGGNGAGAAGAGTGAGSSAAGGGTTQPQCADLDHDGIADCNGDCNDHDAAIKPGAVETLNQKDDDCDLKIDNHIMGADFDHDGSNFGETDCNDDEPLVGPFAIEDPSNKVDDNCNGQIDEAAPVCDGSLTGTTAGDYAKAIGLCGFVTGSSFVAGSANARNIRTGFGDMFTPKSGAQMVYLSTGTAKDNKEMPTYDPQPGYTFNTSTSHDASVPNSWLQRPMRPYTAAVGAAAISWARRRMVAAPTRQALSTRSGVNGVASVRTSSTPFTRPSRAPRRTKSSANRTWQIASSNAASVPGWIGIHSSARAAVPVRRGSITTVLPPRARMRSISPKASGQASKLPCDACGLPPMMTQYSVRWMSGVGIHHMLPYMSMQATFFGH